MSEDFGSYLKHERELRGVPLDDVAESTKIGIRFLRALEENRFEDLPGEVFVKGFIRSYGQAIGSNVDELLAAYHESGSKHKEPEASHMEAPLSKSKEEPSERRSEFPMKAVLGFGAALLILAGGAYWITSKKGGNPAPVQQIQPVSPATVDNSLPEIEEEVESTPLEEASVPSSISENQISEPSPPAASSPVETLAPGNPEKTATEVAGAQKPVKNTFTVPENIDTIKDIQDQSVHGSTDDPPAEEASGESPLNLVIRVDENSWFNLRVDDQRDQDFILPPGGSKTIQAKVAVVVTIGNRRATQLILNGQQLDLPESPDNVIRNLTVNAEQLN